MIAFDPVSAAPMGELLRQAATVLPQRVTYAGMHLAQVKWRACRRNVEYGNVESYVWLEAACQEEFDARGWHWRVERHPPSTYVVTVTTGRGEFGVHFGHVPLAEVMLRALLNAMECER